jgi:hypothetical protein
VAEAPEGAAVGRHGVVVELAAHDLSQPLALCWYWLVHALSRRLLDFLQLGLQAVAPALPVDQELAGARKPETFNFLGFTFICGKS